MELIRDGVIEGEITLVSLGGMAPTPVIDLNGLPKLVLGKVGLSDRFWVTCGRS